MKFTRKFKIQDFITQGRVLVVYGPRRVGKTTLVKEYLDSLDKTVKSIYLTGDDFDLQDLFRSGSKTKLINFAHQYEVIVIDEAQMIPNIGLGIKMIIDELPDKNIILTGSSALLLSEEVGSPLLGRHFERKILPISFDDIDGSNFDKKNNLESLLIYGSYPEILLTDNDLEKEIKLKEIVKSYLFKDAFIKEGIKSSEILINIVKTLAFNIGREISLNEIARNVNTDQKTVIKYIDILEKVFIIKKIYAFSNNKGNEIRKNVKYYFYDVGIRNAIVSQFQSLTNRDSKDSGHLFENYIFMEMYKKEIMKNPYFNEIFFWRNNKGREVDIIIVHNDKIKAYECKWKDQKVVFTDFLENYPKAETFVIAKENMENFLE
jgi:predicted AAA+ superfamily ATPase